VRPAVGPFPPAHPPPSKPDRGRPSAGILARRTRGD
jgi:hypothetical protein